MVPGPENAQRSLRSFVDRTAWSMTVVLELSVDALVRNPNAISLVAVKNCTTLVCNLFLDASAANCRDTALTSLNRSETGQGFVVSFALFRLYVMWLTSLFARWRAESNVVGMVPGFHSPGELKKSPAT